MDEDGFDELRIHGVSQGGDYAEDREKSDIQNKEDDGNPVQPAGVVREGIQQDGHNPCAHVDGEPSGLLVWQIWLDTRGDLRGGEAADDPSPTDIVVWRDVEGRI